jgi:hypothetical protein
VLRSRRRRQQWSRRGSDLGDEGTDFVKESRRGEVPTPTETRGEGTVQSRIRGRRMSLVPPAMMTASNWPPNVRRAPTAAPKRCSYPALTPPGTKPNEMSRVWPSCWRIVRRDSPGSRPHCPQVTRNRELGSQDHDAARLETTGSNTLRNPAGYPPFRASIEERHLDATRDGIG